MSFTSALTGGISAMYLQNLIDKYKLGAGNPTTIRSWAKQAYDAIVIFEKEITPEQYVRNIRSWDDRGNVDIKKFPFFEHPKLQINGELGKDYEKAWVDYCTHATGYYKDFLLAKDNMRNLLKEAGVSANELQQHQDTNISPAEAPALSLYKSNIGPLKFLTTWTVHFGDLTAAYTSFNRGWQKILGDNDAAAVFTNLRNPLDMSTKNVDLLVAMDAEIGSTNDFARAYTFDNNLASAMHGGAGMYVNRAYGGGGPISLLMHEDLITVTNIFRGQSYLFLKKLQNENTPGYDTSIPIVNPKTNKLYSAYEFTIDILPIASEKNKDLIHNGEIVTNKAINSNDLVLSRDEKLSFTPKELSEKLSLNHLIHYTMMAAQSAEGAFASAKNLGYLEDYNQMRTLAEYFQAATKIGIDLPETVYYSKIVHDENGNINENLSVKRENDTYPIETKQRKTKSGETIELAINQQNPVPNRQAPMQPLGRDLFLAKFYLDQISIERRGNLNKPDASKDTLRAALFNRYLSTFRFDDANDENIANTVKQKGLYPDDIESRYYPRKDPKILSQNELDKRIEMDNSGKAEKSISQVVDYSKEVVNADWEKNIGINAQHKFKNIKGDRTNGGAITKISTVAVAKEVFSSPGKMGGIASALENFFVPQGGIIGSIIYRDKGMFYDILPGSKNNSVNHTNDDGSHNNPKGISGSGLLLGTLKAIAFNLPGKIGKAAWGNTGLFKLLNVTANIFYTTTMLHFATAKSLQPFDQIMEVGTGGSGRKFHKEVYNSAIGVDSTSRDSVITVSPNDKFYLNGHFVDIQKTAKITIPAGTTVFTQEEYNQMHRRNVEKVIGLEGNNIKIDSEKLFLKYSTSVPLPYSLIGIGNIKTFDLSKQAPELQEKRYFEEKVKDLKESKPTTETKPDSVVTNNSVSAVGPVKQRNIDKLIAAAKEEPWTLKATSTINNTNGFEKS
jgi:hypothetical protein